MFNLTRWTKRSLLIGLVASAVLLASGPSFNVSAAPPRAISPPLGAAASFSVLGGQAVTCTGSTTTSGAVGVSPLTSITGFPSPCSAGGGTHSNDSSAIAAQAASLTIFGLLDQPCDHSYASGQDLTLISPLVPGVYCSAGSFLLTKNLNLTGSGVWIFKTVSTLITSPGSSVTGGDPCNVWWRIGSSTTLELTTSFIGNVFSQNGVNAMKTGARLNGRFLGLSAATVTLDSNTISGPVCAVPPPAATKTAVVVIKTATALSVLLTPRPGGGGGGGGGGNQATSAPAEISAATATPTATLPAVLPTTGGSGSNDLTLFWLALGVAGAALVGFPLLIRRRRQRKVH